MFGFLGRGKLDDGDRREAERWREKAYGLRGEARLAHMVGGAPGGWVRGAGAKMQRVGGRRVVGGESVWRLVRKSRAELGRPVSKREAKLSTYPRRVWRPRRRGHGRQPC